MIELASKLLNVHKRKKQFFKKPFTSWFFSQLHTCIQSVKVGQEWQPFPSHTKPSGRSSRPKQLKTSRKLSGPWKQLPFPAGKWLTSTTCTVNHTCVMYGTANGCEWTMKSFTRKFWAMWPLSPTYTFTSCLEKCLQIPLISGGRNAHTMWYLRSHTVSCPWMTK